MLKLNIRKQLEPFELSVSEDVPTDGVTALFGPSGAGKTMLLRLVAGFEKGIGRIEFNDSIWFDSTQKINVQPHKRPVGFVHQRPVLFNHLNVFSNLKVPLRFTRSRQQHTQLDDVVDIFGLAPLLNQSPPTLSGGERQRVAIAQMVLSQPSLMFLDEPLAGLDLDRKAEILPFLQTLAYQLKIPTIYVSHEIEEITQLCDRVLVIEAGQINQFKKTGELFQHLELHTLSCRLEAGSIVEAKCRSHDDAYHLTHLEIDNQMISVPILPALEINQTVKLRIRARDVSISLSRPTDVSIRNILAGRIRSIQPIDESPFVEVTIGCDSTIVRARITRAALDALTLHQDMQVFALIKSVSFDSL